MRLKLAIGAALLLAACGGGSGDRPIYVGNDTLANSVSQNMAYVDPTLPIDVAANRQASDTPPAAAPGPAPRRPVGH